MNFNDNFDLKKAKSFLLTETVVTERFADKITDVNPLTGEKERVIYEEEEYRMGIFDDIDADLMDEEDRIGYLDAIIKYCTKQMEDIGNDNGGLDDTNSLDEAEELDEMAKIAGDLKSSIEAVIKANPELEGLALKKAIKGNSAVIDALDGDDLYDNQLNKFIALTKGERELGQRGRKADPNKPAAEPKAPKTPGEKKIKITTPKSEPATDDKIDAGVEKDSRSKDEMIIAKRELEAERMEIAKAYKNGDTSVISKLKDLTAQINKLNKRLGV
jgi:hypothetical protein